MGNVWPTIGRKISFSKGEAGEYPVFRLIRDPAREIRTIHTYCICTFTDAVT